MRFSPAEIALRCPGLLDDELGAVEGTRTRCSSNLSPTHSVGLFQHELEPLGARAGVAAKTAAPRRRLEHAGEPVGAPRSR